MRPAPDLAVPVRQLDHARDLALPHYATAAAAGLDLLAAVMDVQDLVPGARAIVPTGIALALPPGFEGQVRPRSGLAANHGITLLNAPGTIDADYRGEVGVILINLSDRTFRIERGMRIAQLVIAPVTRITWSPVSILPASDRNEGGFGSTGLTGGPPAAPSPSIPANTEDSNA